MVSTSKNRQFASVLPINKYWVLTPGLNRRRHRKEALKSRQQVTQSICLDDIVVNLMRAFWLRVVSLFSTWRKIVQKKNSHYKWMCACRKLGRIWKAWSQNKTMLSCHLQATSDNVCFFFPRWFFVCFLPLPVADIFSLIGKW